MEDNVEEKTSMYEVIIKDYIKTMKSQLHIVPITNNIVSAQVLADSKQMDAYGWIWKIFCIFAVKFKLVRYEKDL